MEGPIFIFAKTFGKTKTKTIRKNKEGNDELRKI
jgi:hypothetical protein